MGKTITHQGVEVELDDDVDPVMLDLGPTAKLRATRLDVDAIYAEECAKEGEAP